MEHVLSLINGVRLAERALKITLIHLWGFECPILHAKLNKCVLYMLHVL